MTIIKTPKKLIEVALPLDEINEASAREKSIRHGHPSTLHLWWARRPLATARAVIFAQMVNDPGYERTLGRGVNKEKAAIERERLFGILRRLVVWENTNDQALIAEARAEIQKSWLETCELNKAHPMASELFNPEKLPEFHDPFAGGGALPLEAKRLGMASTASDLNPVPVLINKAMIEIPPMFSGVAPIGPMPTGQTQGKLEQEDWLGSKGLAEDVRRYGGWMRDTAEQLIGNLYPKARLPESAGGGEATVIAWLWVRTVKSPNPAYSDIDVPLSSTFILYGKAGKERYVEPVIAGNEYRFEIREGAPPESAKNGTKLARGANFRCIFSDTPIEPKYIYSEATAGRLGSRLMAVVAEGARGRIYLPPTVEMERVSREAKPEWRPEVEMPANPRWFSPPLYGLKTYGDLFTERQLVALTTFASLVQESRKKVKADAIAVGMADDGRGLDAGGRGATAYGEAISVYLACALGKVANIGSTVASWMNDRGAFRETFARQAIQMTWDYAESNPFADAGGSFLTAIAKGAMAVEALPADGKGKAMQSNASTQELSRDKIVSTDPPYYDNIGYADLSDFFYVWLRRALRPIYPDLFATMAVPKDEELVATPYRHGGKKKAEIFFLEGMTHAMKRLAEQVHPAYPTTIYYAFKQSDTSDVGTGNTGWETFLQAVIRAGFAITGTWPMRTEGAGRLVAKGTNALASSIVLVCRQKSDEAPTVSRRDFLRELKVELKEAVEVMIGGANGISPVAPVDLAQAVIGPGMGIFSKYGAVLEADGSPMTVHTALTLINRMLTEGADDFDADTQFSLSWFEDQGWTAGEFGKADVLARAKGTSVDHVREAGVIKSASGRVRLLKPLEYSSGWRPESDNNTPVWEALHQLIRELRASGESAAGSLLAGMPERAEPIRSLAYRLYTLCERKGWTDDARGYNELITSWTGIEVASHEKGRYGSQAILEM